MAEEEKKEDEPEGFDAKQLEKEECNPLVEECDNISTECRGLARDCELIDNGIRHLQESMKFFEDPKLEAALKDAKRLKKEIEDKMFADYKRYNSCKTLEEQKEEPEGTEKETPETEVSSGVAPSPEAESTLTGKKTEEPIE